MLCLSGFELYSRWVPLNSILVCKRKKLSGLPTGKRMPLQCFCCKLLPMDTTENFTKLMNYSGLYKSKKITGLNHRQINTPVFLQRKVNFYPRTQQKMLQH